MDTQDLMVQPMFDEVGIDQAPREADEQLLSMLLRKYFGNEVWDDSAESTARRVLKTWIEFDPRRQAYPAITTFRAAGTGIVIVKDIDFASLCSHHLFPFYGKAHVAYIPDQLQIGLSKIPRLVQLHAKAPQTQEWLTAAILDSVQLNVKPKGVAVVIESRHTCMACRGVAAYHGLMQTSEVSGLFKESPAVRDEFLRLLARPSSL